MAAEPTNRWDPGLYDSRARFVREGGAPVLELMAPQPGERVLDLGCGSGHLTRALADRGARVLGVDASAAMLNDARAAYPGLAFQLGRAEELPFEAAFDAIFSNAALHWVPRAEEAARGMFRALRPGGRLAAEFGGFQNVAAVRAAVSAGLTALGRAETAWNPWYFPRLGQYSNVLEDAGFTVRFAHWFPRPSPMPDQPGQSGIACWLSIFASDVCESLTASERTPFFAAVEQHARGALFRDGTWWIDYVRLRVEAVKPC